MGKITIKVINNIIHSIEGYDTQVEVLDDDRTVHMDFKKQEHKYETRKIVDLSLIHISEPTRPY